MSSPCVVSCLIAINYFHQHSNFVLILDGGEMLHLNLRTAMIKSISCFCLFVCFNAHEKVAHACTVKHVLL